MYLCCLGHSLAEDLNLDVTEGGVEGDRLLAPQVGESSDQRDR